MPASAERADLKAKVPRGSVAMERNFALPTANVDAGRGTY